MPSIIKTITEKAGASWQGGDVTKENYKDFASHWIACARVWHSELLAEGLVETAAAVENAVAFEIRTH